MSIEVIVPALIVPQRLLHSLSLGSQRPGLVSIVSNEIDVADVDPCGLDVRVIRFSSDRYRVGEMDVVLRRNVGIWASVFPDLLFQDDDQVASGSMVEMSAGMLRAKRIFWGHHRFIDFAEWSTSDLTRMSPLHGRSRESAVNVAHGFYSCYAGMFGAQRSFLIDSGAFDMAFMGRHGGEDQQLGRRTGGDYVEVWEPPFAWHPLVSPGRNHVQPFPCEHDLEHRPVGSTMFKWCTRCPYYLAEGDLSAPRLILPYDPDGVRIEIETIGA